eukprot:3313236-Pyramimonas_sp.AAC.1
MNIEVQDMLDGAVGGDGGFAPIAGVIAGAVEDPIPLEAGGVVGDGIADDDAVGDEGAVPPPVPFPAPPPVPVGDGVEFAGASASDDFIEGQRVTTETQKLPSGGGA